MTPFRAILKFTVIACTMVFAAPFALAQIPKPTDAPKPMTPEQSAAAFKLPEGFRMEVVASEPLIASPSAVCWDERGRMFVSELHGYNLAGQLDIEELNKTGQLDTQVRRVQADEKFQRAAKAGMFGVVKLLRDANGDGRMDAAIVWATNLPPIYGIVPARGGVIVACAPDIVFLADRDGDGKAETREVLFTGFPTGELERGINAPQWGVDGWIYFGRGWGGGKITGPHLREPVPLPGSDFRIRADGSAIEPVAGATHTFGFAMTSSGDRFTVTTTIPGIYIAPLPWRYLARNPDAATPALEAATGDRRAYSISKPHPWRQKRADDPAYFKYYNSRYGAAESEADGWFTAACGPMVYQDRVLPGLRGQYFVCEPAGNLIHRALIEADGSALKLRRATGEEQSEFAASTDAWCHPMNLTHGPDGSIWVTDYYREIIEDYSAIPRHLQQQYGVFAGHNRGRVYRLTHRDAPRAPTADLSTLETKALVRECASPLFWRRQTAQRLLVERGEKNAAPALRELLADRNAESSAAIIALRTLEQLGALAPSDAEPFISHADPAVRIHALQIADLWFPKDEGRALLDATLAAADAEQNPRVQIQFALSLGEARDPRAFAMLARFTRERLGVRWMDAAVLSSLHGRGLEMLGALLREPGGSARFLALLAQSIAARRDELELAGTLKLAATAKPDTQTALLDALAKGRKNAPRKPLADKSARAALATLAASPLAEVRTSARALEDTFVASMADDESWVPAGQLPVMEAVSDEAFRIFVAALAGPRDLKHGHELFLQVCAVCHRIGNEGNEVGPDLLGQLGMAEESLLKDILMPSERIRPGYETTLAQTRDGGAMTGLLRDDGATSLTLVQPGGVERVLLRKDVMGVRRLAMSLMPSFAEGLKPSDLADLLAWLRSHLGTGAPKATEARKANDDALNELAGGPIPAPAKASAPVDFIDASFENASPLWYEIDSAGVVQIQLQYDHERGSPNRAAGHIHFQLQAKAGARFTLEFQNLQNIYNGRPGSVANELKAVVVSEDGRHWRSVATQPLPGNRVLLDVEMPGPKLFVARVEPYRLSDLDALLNSIREHPRVHIAEIGKTLEGRALEIVRIGDSAVQHRIFLRARAHPWEAGGNWVVQGLIRRLLRGDEDAQRFLRRYCVYVLPMANKDGVARGRTRFNSNGKDLNRNWDKPADPQFAPENRALEEWLEGMIAANQKPHLALELHNDGNGKLHISRPPVPDLNRYLERMATLEALLRKHTWFAEGSTGETFRNSGTLGDGWLERYGIDALVHEFNCHWSAGLGRTPLGRDWEAYGEGLARVFDEYFAERK